MKVISLDINKKIVSIKTVNEGYILGTNDLVSDLGEMGQIQQTDGSFINDTTPIIPVIPQPTNQEVMDMQITVLDLVVTVIENQLGGM